MLPQLSESRAAELQPSTTSTSFPRHQFGLKRKRTCNPQLALDMGLTVILCGFKVPIAVLDRFLASNGVIATNGIPPLPFYLPGKCATVLDPQSACLRARLVQAGGDTDS